MKSRDNGPADNVPVPIQAMAPKPGSIIMAMSFQAITFWDKKAERQIIMLYALGQDGVVREFANGKWNSYPIVRES